MKKFRSFSIMLATFCGFGTLPAVAHAQDCSDKTEFLSEEWMLAKGDCAADKLIDKGTSALTEIGIDVLKAGMDYYVPGISSVIFKEQDPFAAHFAELKNHMTMEADRIIDEILDQRRRDNTLEVMGALRAMEDFADEPMFLRASKVDSVYQVGEVLERLSMDLMWPSEADWEQDVYFDFDFSEMTPDDIDRVHLVMTTNSLREEYFPQVATAEAYRAIVDDQDDPTLSELLSVADVAATEADGDLELMLEDVSLYFEAIDDKDLFRQRSDQRFKWQGMTTPCIVMGQQLHKAAVGQNPLTTSVRSTWTFYFFGVGRGGTPPGCWGTWTTGAVTWWEPDGTEHNVAGPITTQEFQLLMQYSDAGLRGKAYLDFLLGSYGTLRPVIASWYRKAGKTAPKLGLDDDLTAALRRNSSVAHLLDKMDELVGGKLSAADKRAAEDIVVASGHGALYTFALAAAVSDYLNDRRELPLRDMRRFLRGEAGPELVHALAAAKFNAITQL